LNLLFDWPREWTKSGHLCQHAMTTAEFTAIGREMVHGQATL
jgi:hypothetical protein